MQPLLTPAMVERVSDKEVRVAVPAAPGYAIARPETVMVTLPASLLSSQEQIVATPSLRIGALRGTAALGGPLLTAATEASLTEAMASPDAAAALTLEISVGGGDGWVAGVGERGHPATTALLQSLRSLQDEPGGWNAVVAPLLGDANVSTPANGTVTLRLPQRCVACEPYVIAAPETVRLVIPGAALRAGSPIVAAGEIAINAPAAIEPPARARPS